MTNPDDPAFPTDSEGQIAANQYHFTGLTKREEFAKAVMQGLARTDLYFGTLEKPSNPWPWVAGEAAKAADAMIAELNKEPI